jgi:hypothetical protein
MSTADDRVWRDSRAIVAVKPREPFARYFKAAADELARRRERKRGDKGGSDGSPVRERNRIEIRA